MLFTILTGDGTRLTRPLKLLRDGRCATRSSSLRTLWPRRWSRRTVILLVMQTLDNSIRLRPSAACSASAPRLQTQEDPDKPNPRFIPVADRVTPRARPRSSTRSRRAGITEALLNIPTTAHILGGAVIGERPETGVVDAHQRVFGYENLLVCDGAAIPANVGVNPSLTITAMAEHAMSHIPDREPRSDAGRHRHGRRPPVIPSARMALSTAKFVLGRRASPSWSWSSA